MTGKKMNYSKNKLNRALNSVREGKYKICEAARIFQIPRQTLADKIKGRRPPGYCKPGPQAVLGTDVESKIETWLLENAKCGFPLSREGVEFSVKYIVERIPEAIRSSIPFKNNTPGKGWFKSFKKRHPQVVLQYCDNPSKKCMLSDDDVKLWHENVEQLLDEKNCTDLIQDPSRIFVMNELIVALDQDNSLSLLERKKSQKVATKSYSESTFTIFLVANASGEFAPPLIITKNSQLFDNLAGKVSGKWGVLSSESCLLSSETFYDYVTNIFYPYLLHRNVTFPIVVFVNEDFFCTSLPLTEFCRNNNIIFLGMLKNTSHFLNPLNTTSDFPLDMLRKEDNEKLFYDSCIDHPIVLLVEDLLSSSAIQKCIIDRFQSCSIYPFAYSKEKESSEHITAVCVYEESRPTLINYFESKIPHEVLKKFQRCKSGNLPWNGPKKYEALFNFWLNAYKDFTSEESLTDTERSFDVEDSLNDNLEDFIMEEEIEIC